MYFLWDPVELLCNLDDIFFLLQSRYMYKIFFSLHMYIHMILYSLYKCVNEVRIFGHSAKSIVLETQLESSFIT